MSFSSLKCKCNMKCLSIMQNHIDIFKVKCICYANKINSFVNFWWTYDSWKSWGTILWPWKKLCHLMFVPYDLKKSKEDGLKRICSSLGDLKYKCNIKFLWLSLDDPKCNYKCNLKYLFIMENIFFLLNLNVFFTQLLTLNGFMNLKKIMEWYILDP